MTLAMINESVERYAVGKTWYWYVPLWLFGLYATHELFQFDMVHGQMPIVLIIPYSFNFALHEIAHIVVAFLPAILVAAAGSGSELLLGTGLIIMAVWQRSYFALLFCALWFALACQSAGQYMADAVPQQLPLVSLGAALSGGDAKHDWRFVFGQLGLLPESGAIGMSLRVIGMVVAFAALIFTAWTIYKMSRAPRWAPAEQLAPSAEPTIHLDSDTVFTPKHTPAHEQPDDDAPPPGATDSFS